MLTTINIADYFNDYGHIALVDVRSPGEFEQGHIPGAFSIPLFNNEERARVGTIYKQQSKEKAIALGYKIVTPKLQWYVDEAKKVSPNNAIVVHCWRGGMRSKSFAEHLHDNGFEKVFVIEGGYKNYRAHARDAYNKAYTINILGGYTGSGKTHILTYLKKQGEQIIDLEAIANHRGSAFGRLTGKAQPTTEQFENNLFVEWNALDLRKPIWLEDESQNIGDVNLPPNLYARMRDAKVYFLDIPKEARARLLVNDYTADSDDKLMSAILRIKKRLGGLRTQQAIEHLKQKNYLEVAVLLLDYYDKFYLKGLLKRDKASIKTLELPNEDIEFNAKALLKIAQNTPTTC